MSAGARFYKVTEEYIGVSVNQDKYKLTLQDAQRLRNDLTAALREANYEREKA